MFITVKTLYAVFWSVLISLLAWSCTGKNEGSEGEPTERASGASLQEKGAQGSDYESPRKIDWLDYDEGMRLVVGSSKFAIIYFDTTDCAPCMWMEDSLFSNPEVVAAIRKDFVPIKVQSARADTIHYQGMMFTESELRKIFMLPGYPMVLFVEGERNQIVGGQPSIIRPERMLDYMRYHTSRAYRSVTFNEYLASLGRDTL